MEGSVLEVLDASTGALLAAQTIPEPAGSDLRGIVYGSNGQIPTEVIRSRFNSDFTKVTFTADKTEFGSTPVGWIDLESGETWTTPDEYDSSAFSNTVLRRSDPVFVPCTDEFQFLQSDADIFDSPVVPVRMTASGEYNEGDEIDCDQGDLFNLTAIGPEMARCSWAVANRDDSIEVLPRGTIPELSFPKQRVEIERSEIVGLDSDDFHCDPVIWVDDTRYLCTFGSQSIGLVTVDPKSHTQSGTEVVEEGNRRSGTPAVSPNLDLAAFVSCKDQDCGLFTVPLKGGEPTLLPAAEDMGLMYTLLEWQ